MTDLEAFDEFWKLYPRKIAKGAARKAWGKTAHIRPELSRLLKAVIVARASDQWRKDGGAYVPHASTWLNQERWDDIHEVEIDSVRDGKAWNETVSGVERKARELGIEWNPNEETFQQFAHRVRQISDSRNVVPIQR